MNLAALSIKRPIFITCVVILILAVGYLSLKKLPVDLFPNVQFPIVTVTTPYPGAGPQEVETLVSKIYEDELSTLPGIKSVSSINKESISIVITEFTLETDIKYAEQQVRDRVSAARRKLPSDIKEATIRRLDPADQPILTISLAANLPDAKLFDLADEVIRPKIEQVSQVGLVEVLGGRKREIRVELDRKKLKSYEVSAGQVAARIGMAGANVPAGKVEKGAKTETVFRTLGEFKNIQEIGTTVVNFIGNDTPVTVNELGKVYDDLVDRKSITYVNGKKSLLINVYRQSGSNTIAVAKNVLKRIDTLKETYKDSPEQVTLSVVRDGSKPIHDNVDDVNESIIIGIILTILVVFFFLGSARSTLITGLALPNSLLGAFILIALAGFSVNIMTLLALSLAVGLLIDDAIVVRENIFRYMEMGKSPKEASILGTNEVTLAVVATTLTVIAVFGPIAFLKGVVGQFFREFGFTICFAMAISLFDALTIAPMLSTYFAGKVSPHHGGHAGPPKGIYGQTIGRVLGWFNSFQNGLEFLYGKVLGGTLKHPFLVLSGALGIFILSLFLTKYIPKTFLPPQDQGEFSIKLDMPPGTSLERMDEVAQLANTKLRSHPEVKMAVLTVGSKDGEANQANFYVNLVPGKQRKMDTSQFKEMVREDFKELSYANPSVSDYDAVGGGQRPFNVNIQGQDMEQLEKEANNLFQKLKAFPGLKDADISYRPGKPETQVIPDRHKAELLGVSTTLLGSELRTQVEGATPSVFRENGREFDIRVRLQENQRDLKNGFAETYVPNINQTLVKLSSVGQVVETTGPANITRQDRGRYIQISGDLTPGGVGMGGVMEYTKQILEKENPLPKGMGYRFIGQAENFKELIESIVVAAGLGILFIYLVLASLYESFVTPFTIMLVLPLAVCGAFFALFITQSSLDLFSMIGLIMLLGVATKNSIILVDYTGQLMAQGKDMREAIIEAGKARLRPILMTSFALIAGMIPVAIGLNEASKQRTSMGIAIIGGVISSTLLTLVVVPAAYSYIERMRRFGLKYGKKFLGTTEEV